ncbi:NAD-dependent epimerase/dehydratase family protein [Natronorubrum sp. A-ect3]|uniref:NAD-dependent epimerase/dehydratase family protein n=1 Tax=Natronorubrum sp. A-ect3 TaxID=3242698 RepID=UPI00359E3230
MGVLITGATGLVGSQLVDRLAADRTVFAGVRRPAETEFERATPVELQLGRHGLETTLDWTRVDTVVHTAAYTDAHGSVDEPLHCFGVNATGTAAILEAARSASVDHVVALSSYHVYDGSQTGRLSESAATDAGTPYAASKLAADAQCCAYDRQYDMTVSIVRPFNVYGPGGRPHQVVPSFISQALSDGVIEPYPGNPVRDFLYVDDLCDAIVAVLEREVSGPLNVGQGTGTSIHELAQTVASVAEAHTDRPVRVIHAGDLEPTDPTIADPSRIERELNWTAETTLSDGLNQTITHERTR